MSDISPICFDRGGIKISQPKAITAAEEVITLNDIAQLLEVYQELKAIDFSKLPDSAIGAFREKAGGSDFAVVLMVKALSEKSFSGEEKTAVDELLAQLRRIAEKYGRLFDGDNPLVSPKTRDRYNQAEIQIEKEIPKGALRKKALAALEAVIKQLVLGLSKGAKNKLKISEASWIDKISVKQVNDLIGEKCKPGLLTQQPASQAAPKSEKRKLDYSFRLVSGFGHRALGKDRPEVLAAEERGVLIQGGVSARYNFSKRYALQLDYNFSAPYDVIGKDNLVSNDDFGRLSLTARPLGSLDIHAQVGWRNYRNDYPSAETPDLNGLVQNLRINWRAFAGLPKLSLNLDQSLIAGWTNISFPADRSGFRLVRAAGEPGASLKVGAFTPFIGGIAGKGDEGTILGGFAGSVFDLGNHQANLRLQYATHEGLSSAIRYLYDRGGWKVGALAFYRNLNLSDNHQAGGGAFAIIRLVKILGLDLELQPFANAAYEKGVVSALNFIFGVMLGLGGLRPSQPSALTPDSVKSLPEER
jgi:hypothetical protein